MRVSFLFDNCLQTPSTFLIISLYFKSQILYIYVENVTPKILKGPCVQSNLKLWHIHVVELLNEPIHIALVFTAFILSPDIV